ncbi:hypothetical protein [Rossellomorea sp. LjRoot5]|uniref:hypothetical protein n=1 Tax=Rossellomorea sp. LjRoot5 TaxID=3342331 RepID=UPI003ED10367
MLKQMAASIIHRFKKLFILLCIIPILTAGIAYFMEMGKETTYTASTKIVLGNFENEKLTNPSVVKTFYQSEKPLKEVIKEENLDYSVNEIKDGFSIEEQGNKVIEMKYTSKDNNKSEEIVLGLSEYFLSISEKKLNNKIKLVEDGLERVKETEKNRGYLEREELEYRTDNEFILENFRETKQLEPVTVSTSSNNPLKKAIFGFLVGIMLSLFILLIPELFKEYRDDERV